MRVASSSRRDVDEHMNARAEEWRVTAAGSTVHDTGENGRDETDPRAHRW